MMLPLRWAGKIWNSLVDATRLRASPLPIQILVVGLGVLALPPVVALNVFWELLEIISYGPIVIEDSWTSGQWSRLLSSTWYNT
jgi:hypothetical protein